MQPNIEIVFRAPIFVQASRAVEFVQEPAPRKPPRRRQSPQQRKIAMLAKIFIEGGRPSPGAAAHHREGTAGRVMPLQQKFIFSSASVESLSFHRWLSSATVAPTCWESQQKWVDAAQMPRNTQHRLLHISTVSCYSLIRKTPTIRKKAGEFLLLGVPGQY